MSKVLVDIERKKYPYSGLGVFCSCLEAGIEEQKSSEPYQIAFYGVEDTGAISEQYRWWHRYINFTPYSYDVLHVTHQLQKYFPYVSAQTKCILTLHDLNFLYENIGKGSYRRKYSKVSENINRADVIICISHFVKQCLEQNLHLFNPKPTLRIEVIHNGIMFSDIEPICPSSFTLTPKSYYLSIGVLQDKKQQHQLIQMLSYLPQDQHLVLVYSAGHAEYEVLLKQLIGQYGLEGRVHFLKDVHTAEKRYLIQNALAYLHPSIAEGFGIPPVEAMYEGIPVFLSKYTSLPEIGGDLAFYFEELEPRAMAQCVESGLGVFTSDESYAERLRLWAEQYDYRQMASKYMACYRSLV